MLSVLCRVEVMLCMLFGIMKCVLMLLVRMVLILLIGVYIIVIELVRVFRMISGRFLL